MFEELVPNEAFEFTGALDALNELEGNTHDAYLAERSSERVELLTKITVRPGNASERHKVTIDGLTADISNGGCKTLLPRAVLPGDYYLLTFADPEVRVESILARCVRCRLVQEDAFETGFNFLGEINLSTLLTA